MTRIIFFIFLTFSLSMANSMDAFDDLDKEFGNEDSEFNNFKQKVDDEFYAYKKSIDDEFSAFLKQTWKEFESFKNPKPYEEPKPKQSPIAKKPKAPKKTEIKSSPIVKVVPIKEEKIIKKPKPKISKYERSVNFDFYGEKAVLNYDKSILFDLRKIDNKSISKAWQKLGKSKTKKLSSQINQYISFLNLNDWAKYLFIQKTGDKIYKDRNKSNIFTWYILAKLGYDIKVGYNNKAVHLLSSMDHKLYQVPFFSIDKKTYYLLSKNTKNVGSLYTYKGNYPKADARLSFEIKKPLKFDGNIRTKKLKFEFENKTYTIDAKYSKDLVAFYNTLPQSDYRVYFDSQNSPQINDSILKELSKYIKGMSELEAVNFLLRFTQKSFEYKTDGDQFSKEKVMFPDETVFFPYSDCEDRSIMFSSLVKNLLGLKVVGLKFPNHLATAVALSSSVSGDSFKHKGQTFTVADPTYINANAGMTMPEYKNTNFSVID